MSNRAKDECITIEGDIKTILREHVVGGRMPDEWCSRCGEWPCPTLYITHKLMKILEILKTTEDPRLAYVSFKQILEEPNKNKNKKKVSYDYDHTCNLWEFGTTYIETIEPSPCLACAIK